VGRLGLFMVLSSFSETRRFSGGRNKVRDAGAHYALMRVPHYFARLRESS